ncbi:hypothetical protein [Chlorobaculum limnaeum]|nr:hypothetical protein [Chlorobaculum limnaeum]
MSFVEKIAGCFGDQDLIFAGHSNDKKNSKRDDDKCIRGRGEF